MCCGKLGDFRFCFSFKKYSLAEAIVERVLKEEAGFVIEDCLALVVELPNKFL